MIDLVLSRPDLSAKYSLRGITRDTSSSKSAALTAKGVDMVRAELDDQASLATAFKDSYGVFGVTDFWSIMSKTREIQQGKNIFHAAQDAKVKHLVFSALPYAEKLTEGKLKHVDHFDSKAIVKEYILENKNAEMWVGFFMPALFIDFAKKQIRAGPDGVPTLAMPFPNDSIAWPLIDPRRDSGKYVLGLFEAGKEADGVSVNGVSTWTTPKEVVAAVGKAAGQEVAFKTIPGEVFASFLPEAVAEELLETMLLVGDYSYYGKGEEKKQKEHEKYLVADADLISFERWVDENGPWKF